LSLSPPAPNTHFPSLNFFTPRRRACLHQRFRPLAAIVDPLGEPLCDVYSALVLCSSCVSRRHRYFRIFHFSAREQPQR
jgi:hypothetical protein